MGGPSQMARKESMGVSHIDVVDVSATDYDPGYTLRGIAFAAEGAIDMTLEDGTRVTIPAGTLAAGTFHPIFFTQIHSGATTATDIIAVY